MSIYEYPPILTGSSYRQLEALRDYLVRMVESLEKAHEQTSQALRAQAEEKSPETKESPGPSAPDNATALRSLIVKTAGSIRQNVEQLSNTLREDYLALSDFGSYAESLEARFSATARQVVEEYDFESGCEYPEIEIRRITGAIKTMSDILVHTENDALLAQMLGYLKLCLYRLVRHLSAGRDKQLAHFKLDFSASNALSSAMISIIEEKIRELNLNTNNQLPAGVGTAENVYGWNALTDIITEAEDRADVLNRFDFTQE